MRHSNRNRARVAQPERQLGRLANPRWMALLASVDGSRSITAAARAARLSYKAAWDAIDTMNNLVGRPVVATTIGGKGGGGARLTPRGRQLLASYRALAVENERFLAGIDARLGQARRDLPVLGRLGLRTSARNQWAGEVVKVRRGSVNDEIEVKLPGGERIVAVITHASAEDLGLAIGREVVALVKSSSVIVGAANVARIALSARNQLTGRVTRITPGAVNTEFVIGLRGGNTVAAIVTNLAARELELEIGQRALAIFKASSVILGVT